MKCFLLNRSIIWYSLTYLIHWSIICVSITDCDLTSTFMQRCDLKTCILSDGQRVVTPLVSERNLIERKPMKKDPPSPSFVRKSWSLSLLPNSTNTDTLAWRRAQPTVPQRRYLRHKIPADVMMWWRLILNGLMMSSFDSKQQLWIKTARKFSSCSETQHDNIVIIFQWQEDRRPRHV